MSVSLYESRILQARSALESERKKQASEEQKAAKLATAAADLRKKGVEGAVAQQCGRLLEAGR